LLQDLGLADAPLLPGSYLDLGPTHSTANGLTSASASRPGTKR
jgi:hypothetical protein